MKVFGLTRRSAERRAAQTATRALSVDDIRQQIYEALDDLTETPPVALMPECDDYCYIEEQYADYCIVSCGAAYWKVPFTIDADSTVVLAAQADWQAVEQQWMTKNLPSRPIRLLSETSDVANLGGWLVVYGGKDLTGETFTKETDFWLDRMGSVKPVLFSHGFDPSVKSAVLGSGTVVPTDYGLWFTMQLAKSKAYVQQVLKLVEAGVLGLSSGAVSHLIEMDGANIKTWPIAEGSVTPTPAEPRTLGIEQLKSLVAHVDALRGLLPEEPPKGSEQADARSTGIPQGLDPLSKQTATPPLPAEPKHAPDTRKDRQDVELAELSAQMEAQAVKTSALTELVEKFLKQMEDAPALRKAGYYTVDGGKADPAIKNFGDFLLAIKRQDAQRLNGVYGSFKSLNEGDSNSGGYLVPPEMRTDLLSVATSASSFLSLIDEIPVTVDAGMWPALDQYVAPTAGVGNTAFAAGVVATRKPEGAELPETEPTFQEIEWKIGKVGGITYVTNELNADSAQSIEKLLRMLFGVAISAKREYYVLRGTGVGEPLGILNAPALVNVTPGTNDLFSYVDAVTMLSRLKVINSAKVRFTMHQSRLPDLADSSWTQGNTLIRIQDLGFGAPVLTEHLPQKTHSGSVVLVDYSSYLLFVRQSLSIAFSEHAAFTSDRGVWRFTERLDGQPWLKGPITLADPNGSFTTSTLVSHND